MRQLCQETVGETIILAQSRWDSYNRTQQARQLVTYDTVDQQLEQLRLETGKLYQETVGCLVTSDTIDRTINLGLSRWNNCITTDLTGCYVSTE